MRHIILSIAKGFVISFALVLFFAAQTTQAATFIVDDIGDAGDNVIDGTCDTGGGVCTLRAAIEEANAQAGADTIEFDIAGAGPHTITLGADLPALADAVGGTTIDGYTQTNATVNTTTEGLDTDLRIIIDGDDTADNIFSITTGGNLIRGINMQNSADNLVAITGANADGNKIQGNFLGTSVDGLTAAGSTGGSGVLIEDGAENNIIGVDGDGTDDVEERNLISANNEFGVEIDGTNTAADGNIVAGNLIGVDSTGNSGLGNGDDGVAVDETDDTRVGSDGNGTSDALERNVISGNDGVGVDIFDADSSIIAGNILGLGADGDTAILNEFEGVFLEATTNTRIGSDNADDNERNIISGNDTDGIGLAETDGTDIFHNVIGLNEAQDAVRANDGTGVLVDDCVNVTIGGVDEGGNVIGGNTDDGIEVFNGIAGPHNLTIQANLIGTDGNGTDFGNEGSGIDIADVETALIGADGDDNDDLFERNQIANNDGDGIEILNSTDIIIAANFIGTDEANFLANVNDGGPFLGNVGDGIFVFDSTDIIIGNNDDASAGEINEPNVIVGNGTNGVSIGQFFANTTGVRVSRNVIFANDDLAIDLGGDGVTNNDIGDGDAGPNNFLNSPVITTVTNTVVTGTIDTPNPDQTTIQVYKLIEANANGSDETGFGELTVFIDEATPNVAGEWTLNGAFDPDEGITAIAIDNNNNTSEAAKNDFPFVNNGGGGGGIRIPGSGFGGTIVDVNTHSLTNFFKEEAVVVDDKNILMTPNGVIVNNIEWNNNVDKIYVRFDSLTSVKQGITGALYTGKLLKPRFTTTPQNNLGETLNKNGEEITVFKAIELTAEHVNDLNFSKKFKLLFALPADVNKNEVTVYYFNNDTKKYEHIGGKVNADGLFEVELEHMSVYALATKAQSDSEAEIETEETTTEDQTAVEETSNEEETTSETPEEASLNDEEVIVELTEEEAAVAGTHFADIVNHWSKDYVITLYEKGAVNGYTKSKFAPDNFVTRAELVKIVLSTFNIEVAENVDLKPFTDVYVGDWYAPYIAKAKELDIVGGFSDGSFRPNDKITRAAAMKILLLAAEADLATSANTQISFTDVDLQSWYATYLKYMVANGIINGYSDNTFRPEANITRGELAKIAVMLSQ